jgi:catechol 2,3-dioxygenase-like lactoylglutathione lyase family enzyme
MWSAMPDAREHGNGYNRLVLRVSDVDAATREVRARGVRIEKEPTDAPGLRYSLLRDPDGYVIELLELRR